MVVNEGGAVFVLRYNDNYIKNSIELHKEICDKQGTCWYGKGGKRPDMRKLERFAEENTKIVLYNRTAVFIGDLIGISEDKPISGYPDYYKNMIWRPTSWYKVAGIEKSDPAILRFLKVESTQKLLSETINSSMTSFYFTRAITDVNSTEEVKIC